jgi:hypothetical protein
MNWDEARPQTNALVCFQWNFPLVEEIGFWHRSATGRFPLSYTIVSFLQFPVRSLYWKTLARFSVGTGKNQGNLQTAVFVRVALLHALRFSFRYRVLDAGRFSSDGSGRRPEADHNVQKADRNHHDHSFSTLKDLYSYLSILDWIQTSGFMS